MYVDFDIFVEFFFDVVFQCVGDVMCCIELYVGVDFEVDVYDQFGVEVVYGDVVDGEVGIVCDYYDVVVYGFVVVCYWYCCEGEVGIVEGCVDGFVCFVFDFFDVVDWVGLWYFGDGVDEGGGVDYVDFEVFDVDYVGDVFDCGCGFFLCVFGCVVEQCLDG